jgi:hypothetical protein
MSKALFETLPTSFSVWKNESLRWFAHLHLNRPLKSKPLQAVVYLCLALLVAAPLGADGPESKWRVGLEATLGMPFEMSQKVSSNGFGVGVFVEEVGSEKQMLAFGIEYVKLGKNNWYAENVAVKKGKEEDEYEYVVTPFDLCTSFDYINISSSIINRFGSIAGGTYFYFYYGLGVGYCKIPNNVGPSASGAVLNFSAGLGYNFRDNFGVKLKFTPVLLSNRFNLKDHDGLAIQQDIGVAVAQVGIQYRF